VTLSVEGFADRAELERFLVGAPIYYQPWWLEAVSPGAWDYAIVRRGSEIAAVMPFVRSKCGFGKTRIRMPPLTHTLGPWLRPSENSHLEQLAEQNELMLELIDSLPEYDAFNQAFHYSVTNWLPFYWKGFTQRTRYTYVLQDLEDLDAVWKEFDPDIRWNIRRAKSRVEVVEDFDFDTFLKVRSMSFTRQGIEPTHTGELLRRVDAACESHKARKMFFAVDASHNIHAVAYIVWTNYAAYYILGGGNTDLRGSGANCLVIWEAIRFSRSVTRSFDFEMALQSEPIERFFRLFGGRLMPYFKVRKFVPFCDACSWFRHRVVHRINLPLYKRFVARAGRWLHRTA